MIRQTDWLGMMQGMWVERLHLPQGLPAGPVQPSSRSNEDVHTWETETSRPVMPPRVTRTRGKLFLVAPALHPGTHVPAHSAAHGRPELVCRGGVVLVRLEPDPYAPDEWVIFCPKQNVVAILHAAGFLVTAVLTPPLAGFSASWTEWSRRAVQSSCEHMQQVASCLSLLEEQSSLHDCVASALLGIGCILGLRRCP